MSELVKRIPVFSLAKRHLVIEKNKITSPETAVKICRELFADTIDIYESFFIVMLDHGNHTIGCACIGVGGIAGVVVDYKLVLHYAAACISSSIILVHNHPSGNLSPSEQDVRLTKDLKQIMKLATMPVVDHLIITPDSYYSFSQSGLLDNL
jgi:DNA repair protein RadC